MQGAPPDGFLIDGHWISCFDRRRNALAHRLTGFSSMDTRLAFGAGKIDQGAPPDGFLIDGQGAADCGVFEFKRRTT